MSEALDLSGIEMDPRMGKYADPHWRRPEVAVADVLTKIIEWSYEEDPHGYCHDRNDLLGVLREIERLQRALAAEQGMRETLLAHCDEVERASEPFRRCFDGGPAPAGISTDEVRAFLSGGAEPPASYLPHPAPEQDPPEPALGQ